MSAPWAEVVSVSGQLVTIRCPYCGAEHVHMVEYLGRPERRAPGCGLTRSGADRATGYRFTTNQKETS